MSKINKILYPSRIEENNLGDILINALLVRELSVNNKVCFKGQPNKQLLDLINQDNDYKDNIEVITQIDISQSFVKTKIKTLSYLIKKSNFYLVFDTPGHISGKRSFIKNILKSFFEITKILTYRILGVGYVKYGITLGPFSNFFWYFQKIIAKLSFLIVVRDQQNATLLVHKGLKNTMLKPDLAFLLVNNNLITPQQQETNNSEGVVTVSLRGSIVGKSLDDTYFKTITKQTINLVHKLKETKKVTRINISYQVDADKKTSFLLEDILKNEFKNTQILLHKEILNFNNASALYQSSNVVITNRLHVFLFAMACNTKSYIVTDIINHKKLISIASDLKMDTLIYTDTSNINWNTDIVKTFLITANKYCKELKHHIATL
jgi:polysaccharide pyruvyl transferase WcaK-like protein